MEKKCPMQKIYTMKIQWRQKVEVVKKGLEEDEGRKESSLEKS
jgi:hypothetical protein